MSINDTFTSVGGPAPPKQKNRGLAKYFIGSPQLSVLPLKLLQPLALIAGQPWLETTVPLGLKNPIAKGLPSATDLGRDRTDGPQLRAVFPGVLRHQPNRPLPHLWRISGLPAHDTILSKVGVSGNPGVIHALITGLV